MKKLTKYILAVALGFSLAMAYLYAKKSDNERKLYTYIGNSIIETPNLMPEDCTVGQMEYYEHLVSIK